MMQRNTPFNKERLLAALQRMPQASVYWVGFSGGADSTALLHALSELVADQGFEVRALHINHGLHEDANTWQSHCEEFCKALNIEILTRHAEIVRNSGSGLEAEARHQRYGIVENILGHDEVFLTAHHSDDQAETLLLNLVRGSGVDGLAGMPESRVLGKGLLARPLLDFSMQSLRHYLEVNDLNWLEDPSNQDQSYDRNFVRQSVIPMLEDRWPRAAERLARSADHCRAASLTLAGWADADLSARLLHPLVLDLSSLDSRGTRFSFLIRHWLRINQAPPLPARRLEELSLQASHASTENQVRIQWAGWGIHLFRGQLWLQVEASISPCPELTWSGTSPVSLGQGVGTLEFEPGVLFRQPIKIDQRRGGERIQVSPGGNHRQVKDILREARVPPWLRASVPILHSKGEVLAVADFVLSPELEKRMGKPRSKLSWQPSDPLLKFIQQHWSTPAVDHVSSLR